MTKKTVSLLPEPPHTLPHPYHPPAMLIRPTLCCLLWALVALTVPPWPLASAT